MEKKVSEAEQESQTSKNAKIEIQGKISLLEIENQSLKDSVAQFE